MGQEALDLRSAIEGRNKHHRKWKGHGLLDAANEDERPCMIRAASSGSTVDQRLVKPCKRRPAATFAVACHGQ